MKQKAKRTATSPDVYFVKVTSRGLNFGDIVRSLPHLSAWHTPIPIPCPSVHTRTDTSNSGIQAFSYLRESVAPGARRVRRKNVRNEPNDAGLAADAPFAADVTHHILLAFGINADVRCGRHS
jgi:hypothetical protein